MKFEIDFIVWLQSFSSPVLDVVATVTSYLFDYPMAILVAVLLFLFYKKSYAVYFAGVFAFSACFQFLLKMLFDRPRPYLVAESIRNIHQALGSSFPSGHSVSSMCIALFVAWVVFNSKLGKKEKGLVYSGLCIYLLLNLLNRSYLGQHYLTDIFAGFALMIMIFIPFVWLYPKFEKVWLRLSNKSSKEEGTLDGNEKK